MRVAVPDTHVRTRAWESGATIGRYTTDRRPGANSDQRLVAAAALVRVPGRLAVLLVFAAVFFAVRPVVVLARLAVVAVARIDFFAVVVVALTPDFAALAVD